MTASTTGFERTTEADMVNDDERREVAQRLRELDYSDLQESLICAYLDALGIKGYEDWIGIAHRLADLIEPTYPDATASYKGWMAEVYDPDGVLASPSNVAANLARAHADGKMRHSTKEEQNEYSAMLKKMSVEMHPVDRDALLALAEEMFGEMRHSTKEEEDAYDAMLKSKSVEIHPVDREALLELADEMDAYSGHFSTGLQECTVQAWAVAIREALGVSK